MEKKVSKLLVMGSLFLLLAAMAYAVDKSGDVSGGTLTVGTSGRITTSSAGNYAAQGGNVTEINVSSAASTIKWAGFFGQVTTSLKLGIGSDALYDFGTAANDQIKTVLASPDSSFDFSQLQTSTQANVDSAWGFTTGDIDSATTVFTETATIATVSSVPVVNLTAHDTTGGALNNTIYRSGLLADTGSPSIQDDFCFGVSVDTNELDFKNDTTVDYELVVPVNNTVVGGTQTYYFFLDVE